MYLALGDSSPRFLQGYLFSQYLRIKTKSSLVFAYEAITRSGSPFQKIQLTNELVTLPSSSKLFKLEDVLILQPLFFVLRQKASLGFSRFARRYSGNQVIYLTNIAKSGSERTRQVQGATTRRISLKRCVEEEQR